MDDLPDVVKSFLKEPNDSSNTKDEVSDPLQNSSNIQKKEDVESPEEKAERELDARKSREALLTEEQQAEIIEECEKHKVNGNNFFGKGLWKEAEDAYTLAIDGSLLNMKDKCAVYYSNRAAARIKRELWDAAIEDCTKAIELKAPNNKPLERRAYAQLHATDDKHLDGALADYNKLLEEKPHHKPYLEAKGLLNKRIAERNEKMKTEMFATLKNLGNMCLRPFGLSTDNFELVEQPGGGYSVKMNK